MNRRLFSVPFEPRAQRGIPAELVQTAPGGEQGLLEHVFGVLERAEDPVAVQLELAPKGVGELPERQLFTGTRAAQQPLAHALHLIRSIDTDLARNESAGSWTPAAVSQSVAHDDRGGSQ
jgi:hypothetical protein